MCFKNFTFFCIYVILIRKYSVFYAKNTVTLIIICSRFRFYVTVGKVLNMLWFSKRKKIKENPALREMDGREVKYVTRMYRDESGEQKSVIVGKAGRIVLIDDEIRVLCGEEDVFRGKMDDCEYFIHMSGDGITVKGPNTVIGADDHIMIFYKYYRK